MVLSETLSVLLCHPRSGSEETKRGEMCREKVKVKTNDRVGQGKRKGYQRIQREEWVQMDKDRLRVQSFGVYVCLLLLLYIEKVSGSKVTPVSRLGGRMDIDGLLFGLQVRPKQQPPGLKSEGNGSSSLNGHFKLVPEERQPPNSSMPVAFVQGVAKLSDKGALSTGGCTN